MPGLILEGGTFRAIFSAGCMDALLDAGIMFPYCIGVSAGITDGFSYISRQKERNLRILTDLRHDKRYVGKRNLIKNKCLFGLEFAYDKVPNELYPFDWDTFRQYKGRLLVGVTNAKTGEAEYKDGKLLDKKCTMLRATCAIPMVFPAIHMEGQAYYDGGLCDPIPVRKSIADGNDRNLIILTRPKGYKKELGKPAKLAAFAMKRKYPVLAPILLNRHEAYNETVAFCEELEAEGKAVILRPDYPIESMEKDIRVINKTYRMGYEKTMGILPKIKEWRL